MIWNIDFLQKNMCKSDSSEMPEKRNTTSEGLICISCESDVNESAEKGCHSRSAANPDPRHKWEITPDQGNLLCQTIFVFECSKQKQSILEKHAFWTSIKIDKRAKA
jgi:hypothetical protein